MVIDWDEGQRWVNARIAKAVEVGYSGFLLEAEQALRGCVVLIAIADGSEPRACWVNFYMTPDTGSLELHYEPTGAVERCRNLAVRIGEILNYELEERN